MKNAAPPPSTQNAGDPDETADLLERFTKWDQLLDAHYGDWLDEAEKCFDMTAGSQWETDEEADMEAQGKIPVTFNRIGPNVDAVSGIEIENRQQVIYEPRQVGASAQNELLTAAADWVRDECDAEHEESDAARDCLICGVGWCETSISYDDEPDGQILISRQDPMTILADPKARKANYADARYIRQKITYSHDEFGEVFPEEDIEGEGTNAFKAPVVVNPRLRYANGSEQVDGDDDTVTVKRYQWFDSAMVYRVVHPDDGSVLMAPAAQFAQLQEAAEAEGVALDYTAQRIKRYRQAWVANEQILRLSDIEVGAFTLHAMTGKRDRNKGVWYGLVRPMLDPQKFSNKLFSQILHIINTNAKGGLMAEADAFLDQREAEDNWSDPAAITWLEPGGMQKIKEKTAPAYPNGMDRLMEVSVSAIRDTTGINQELLGMAQRDQPGILEAQRKKQAYSILSAFFDAFRRYRKIQGRVLVEFMRKFLPPDTLVRIVNDDGSPMYQAIGTAFAQEAVKYNVIVDDTPSGPNQKSVVFQMITQMMPLLQQADLGAEVWAELIKYSPLPTAVANKIASALIQREQQPDPAAQAAQQLQMQGAQAKIAVDQAKAQATQAQAQHHLAQARRLGVEADIAPAQAQADIAVKTAQAGHANAQANHVDVQAATHPQMMDAKMLQAEMAAAQSVVNTANQLYNPTGPNPE